MARRRRVGDVWWRLVVALALLFVLPAPVSPVVLAAGGASPAVGAEWQAAGPTGAGVLAGRVIVLDPGHGGPDPGAVRREGETTEKHVNLEVARRLRDLLGAGGARVVLTREVDARPVAPGAAAPPASEREDLEARVQIANAVGADLFVSLHADVLPEPEKGGALVFWGPGSGYSYSDQRPEELVRGSMEAAHAVLWHLVARTSVVERGAEPAAFYVLGRTRMPSVLVEMGAITNPAEGIFLTGEGFQRRVAEGLFNGIGDYYGARHGAAVVADVTLPDGSIVRPGSEHLKVWRLRNTSRAAIGPGYRVGFYAGDRMDGPLEVQLAREVPPGGEFDVAVPLRMPEGDRGWLFGQWRLRTPGGVWFGPAFWALVVSRGPRPADPASPLPPEAGARYFPETGYNVRGAFRRFYEAAGGERGLGLPLSEEVPWLEPGLPPEQAYPVQTFQRGRLEYRPRQAAGEEAGALEAVQLSLVGDEYLRRRGLLDRPSPIGRIG